MFRAVFKHGLEKNLSTLAIGEPGYCTDTKRLWVGTESGNVHILTGEQFASIAVAINPKSHKGIRFMLLPEKKEIETIETIETKGWWSRFLSFLRRGKLVGGEI